MSRLTVGILAGFVGLGVGLAVGYVVVKQACKDKIADGVVGAVGKLGDRPPRRRSRAESYRNTWPTNDH